LVFIYNYLDAPYSWVPSDHWMLDEKRSGGPIFDLSIHYIDFARASLGVEAEEVLYQTAATTGRVNCYDQAMLLIHYEGGRLGQFTNSWAFPAQANVSHECGFLVCRDGVVTFGSRWEVHTADGKRELEPLGDAYPYRNLISAIEGTGALYADELDGLRTIEILDSAAKSRETGRAERVNLHE
jgi:predicted dehydrogenase